MTSQEQEQVVLPKVTCDCCSNCRILGHGGACEVGHGMVGDVNRLRQCLYFTKRRRKDIYDD